MGSGKDVVVSGTVSSKYVMEKAAEVAGGYVDKKENVVNLLQQQVGVASNQVMLRVRFAEVSRSALQELGASFFANNARSKWFGRTTTGQFPSPEWDERATLVFSDFLNLFVLNTKDGLGAVVRALQNKGLFQSLAEPNLIASNGKEASFLAGGEYPYPIATPSGIGTAFTIMFKEYGVRLNFTPTVLGGDMVTSRSSPRSARSTSTTRSPSRGSASRRWTTPHRDRSGVAGRADVRHRRPDEQQRCPPSCRRFQASATSRFSAPCSRARRTRRTRPSSS